jgi:hypothetical protein
MVVAGRLERDVAGRRTLLQASDQRLNAGARIGHAQPVTLAVQAAGIRHRYINRAAAAKRQARTQSPD